MTRPRVKIDSRGAREVLNRPKLQAEVAALARRIADKVDAELDVVVDEYRTDRVAASVTVREPHARLLEVRDGLLHRAAAAAGQEVRDR